MAVVVATTNPLILDGKSLAARLRADMAERVSIAINAGIRPPGLAVILVGSDPASEIYVANKQKACQQAGIISMPFILPEDIKQIELLQLIESLNKRDDIDGILLQLPLPKHLDAKTCLLAIDPQKDVDGFHPENMGKLLLGLPGLYPCTPLGVMELLRAYELSTDGKKAVVVGRSDIVGKPLALLLTRKSANATVTLCHSATADLARECREADFLFLALGKPEAIKADMVKQGCVVVDIGINRTPNGLKGDADFQSVSKKAAAITPVPGSVGPMTIAMLLKNTISAWEKRLEKI